MNNENGLAVGIDIGGTDIKAGLVLLESGKILHKYSIKTEPNSGSAIIIDNVGNLVQRILDENGLCAKTIRGVGLGIPGMIDSVSGKVLFAGNLGWDGAEVVAPLRERFETNIRIANDANAATLAEVRFGAGKNKQNAVMLTLGTGVGGGFIIDGKLFEGNRAAGAEIGHMQINLKGGELCTCGLRGCFETMASATALVRDTAQALKKNPQSQMHAAISQYGDISAKTPFDFADVDETAAAVINGYVEGLCAGIVNIINIFRPEIIILGGGVSRQGENLLKRLRPLIEARQFARERGPSVELVVAELGNDAGTVGAAMLVM